MGTQFALTALVLQNHFKISLIGAFLTVRVLLLGGGETPEPSNECYPRFFCFKPKFSFNTCYFSKLDCFECSICISEAVQLIPMFQSFSFDHIFKVMGVCLGFSHSKIVNWVVCSLYDVFCLTELLTSRSPTLYGTTASQFAVLGTKFLGIILYHG